MCRNKRLLVITILYLWIGSDTYVFSLRTLYCIHNLYFTSLKMTTLMVEISRSLSHHHSVFCLTTCSKSPPKRFLHIVRSRASSFKWEYPLLSLRSCSSFLHFLLRLLVTSISPFIFPSITCFRRQFLSKIWPIQSLSIWNNFNILVCNCWHYSCAYPINALIMDHIKNA